MKWPHEALKRRIKVVAKGGTRASVIVPTIVGAML